MDRFSPGNVWRWYTARPRWAQAALAIVVLVLLVAAAIWWLLGRMSDPIGSGVDSIADGVGRRAEEAWDDGVDRDKKLADDISELRRVHHEEAARRDGLMRTNEEEHEKLDGADSSAGGVVDALNAARDRHGKRQ